MQVLPAHLARRVAGPSISGMEGPGAQAAMKVREPQIRGFKRPEDIELNEPEGEEYLPEMRTPLSPRFYAAKRAMGGYPEMSAEELEGAELRGMPLERRNPSMFTGTDEDNIGRFNDMAMTAVRSRGRHMGQIKTASGKAGEYEITRAPEDPEDFVASVSLDSEDVVIGTSTAGTPYEAVEFAVEEAEIYLESERKPGSFYGSY